MKRIVLFLLLNTFVSSIVHSQQTYEHEWVKGMGGTDTDDGESLVVDSNGSIITTGSFEGTYYLTPGIGVANLISDGQRDVFIQKLDENGNMLWAKRIGGTGNDGGCAINTDDQGNVYLAGSFEGTVDFDPGSGVVNMTSAATKNLFVLKLDSNGAFVWVRKVANCYPPLNRKMILDEMGNLYLTGAFEVMMEFDPGSGIQNIPSEGASQNAYVLKMDTSGNFLWAKTVGGIQSTYVGGVSISVDLSGNVYSVGNFEGSADFDPGQGNFVLNSASSSDDIYIQKLDSNGAFIWARQIGGNFADYVSSTTTDPLGNIYASGRYEQSADFDPGTGTTILTTPNINAFLLKLDTNGDFVWVKQINNDDYAGYTDLCFGEDDCIYGTGVFRGGIVDFDPGLAINNLWSGVFEDIFIQKLDADGNFVWAQRIGAADSPESSERIVLGELGQLYITGFYRNTVDFDIGTGVADLTSEGGQDVFVLKIKGCMSAATDTHTSCGSYTWIDGQTYTSSNNTATYVLTNAAGCDSIVTLDLTINPVDVSLINNDPTLVAGASNLSYQWIDCSDLSIIPNETGQSFTANSNGEYAVIVSDGVCSDTSSCVSISTVGTTTLSLNEMIFAYPNPSKNGMFTLNFGTGSEMIDRLQINNVLGQTVIEELIPTSNKLSFDLSGAGIYLLLIHMKDGERYTLRLFNEE